MSLGILIDDIGKMKEMHGKELREIKELIRNRIKYPDNFEDPEAKISWHDADEQRKAGYGVMMHAFPKISSNKIFPLLATLFAESRKKRFEKETYVVKTNMIWDADQFSGEINLEDTTRVTVRSSFYEKDPTKVRIGFQGKLHSFEAKMNDRAITLTAKGDYKSLFAAILKEIKPQTADIRISPADARILLEKTSGWRQKGLRHLLKPQKKQFLALDMISGSPTFKSEEVIDITVPVSYISIISNAIGKELLKNESSDETCVLNLNKQYFLRRSILPDLQKILNILSGFKPALMIDQILLTAEQAKTLLNLEIDHISKSYELFMYLGPNTHMMRGKMVRQLAEDQFGDRINEPFEQMGPDKYLEFLKTKGFEYKGELDNAREPEYILKERYLLQFFKQSYLKNPDRAIANYQNWYTNKPSKISIEGEIKSDASRISKLRLPSYAMFSGFELKEAGYGNTNGISISKFDETRISFHMNISAVSHPLLDLQEIACDTLGVKFT